MEDTKNGKQPEEEKQEPKQFECPKCGSKNLSYGDIKYFDVACYYQFICNDCHCHGREWYEYYCTDIDDEYPDEDDEEEDQDEEENEN